MGTLNGPQPDPQARAPSHGPGPSQHSLALLRLFQSAFPEPKPESGLARPSGWHSALPVLRSKLPETPGPPLTLLCALGLASSRPRAPSGAPPGGGGHRPLLATAAPADVLTPAGATWTRTCTGAAAPREGWPATGCRERTALSSRRGHRGQEDKAKETDIQDVAALAQKPSVHRKHTPDPGPAL